METQSKPPARKPHISEEPITFFNWYKHIDWLNVVFVVGIPLIGVVSSYFVPLHPYTFIFAVIFYFNTGLGITAGYHRLWSHTSYKATPILKFYLAACGSGAVQGSIRWWSRGHRAHHRYTDTDKDPYSVRKGLAYSHMGWMVMKQDPKRIGRADITDLNEDPFVVWQHRHYVFSVVAMAWVFPALVCGVWGDWKGGLIYAGILRSCFVQQATFCINSLAHWLGDQPFDDRNSPRDNMITALVTLGEGYHNFHHEFPSDYRNAIQWYQYDPTKWMIWVWKQVGLAYDLKEFRSNEIEKGRVQQLQKKLDQRRAKLDWGVPLDQLPVISWDDFVRDARVDGKALVAIAGVIHDVAGFIQDHPGGKTLIGSAIGKDATAIFNGGVYDHSNAAHNLLSTMRVGVLRGGCEVEAWKMQPSEKEKMVSDSTGQHIVRAGDQVTRMSSV
ncbi:Acyl-CoA desaturase [Pestalotiopsis fici W106-1]|uniref:Acyl-CoA desaturase n=1 Tax=Pestalotiopsis fici (strain W106-1 / CGMCC3.15140) TaxID=1229662 RepID=W3WQ71_PESFW|nr:Acyl-CoA desaturase [Pestalotiopsis fici W106-1]ETS75277.1 Acyl-CoA desaturase [Pestalotiopsis fici W106-1]